MCHSQQYNIVSVKLALSVDFTECEEIGNLCIFLFTPNTNAHAHTEMKLFNVV